MSQHAEDLAAISAKLFEKKRPWDELQNDIAENFYPLRADFISDFTLGDDFAGTVMDGFTINSRETLGNAIDSMLRQGEWFKVGTGDEDRDKKAANALALDTATKQLRRVVGHPRSQFKAATKEADHDWVAFGNPVLSVEESAGRDHLIYRAWHPKLCAWTVNEHGAVDSNHRRFDMTARNIKRKFDTGAWRGDLHRDIEQCCKLEPFKEFPIAHILMPIDELYGDDRAKLREHRHQFISIYLDLTNKQILNERGSKVFNYVIPRWRRMSRYPQGFSPAALNSLPDGRMLQAMARVILEQGEKAVDPPIVGASDVFVREMNLYAGGFTSVDLIEDGDIRNAMQVVDTSQGLQAGMQLKQDVRALIAEAWLLNKLFLPNTREMTAYETSERIEEFRRAALPFFEPIDAEYHTPLLSVSFDMSVNMGIITPEIFPEELQNEDVAFTFISPLKDAEGQKIVNAFNQSVAIISAGSEADPELAQQFDIAEAAIDAVRGTGANPSWILPDDVRMQKKQQAQQVQDIQRSAALLQQGAGAVADVGNAAMTAEAAGLV